MRIADLDHLNDLSNSKVVLGGIVAPNWLTLSFADGRLLLSLGSDTLFQTELPKSPLGYLVSLNNTPGLRFSVSHTTTSGTTSSTSVGVLLQPIGAFTFVSASSSTLVV